MRFVNRDPVRVEARATRERLLDAGERLVAEHGLTGVSLRRIMNEADVNPAAIHYHFGSRDALLEAIFKRRVGDIAARRRTLLDALPEAAPAVRPLLQVVIRPLLELRAELGEPGVTYLRFLAQILRARSPVLLHVITHELGDTFGRLAGMLGEALPHVPRPLLGVRLMLALEAAIGALASPEILAAAAPGEVLDAARLEALLVDFVEGGLAALDSSTPRNPT